MLAQARFDPVLIKPRKISTRSIEVVYDPAVQYFTILPEKTSISGITIRVCTRFNVVTLDEDVSSQDVLLIQTVIDVRLGAAYAYEASPLQVILQHWGLRY
jgi:hypothetical protein